MIYFNQKTGVNQESVILPNGNKKGALSRAIMGYLVSAMAILIAAPFLSEAAGKLAELTGLGKTFVGTTLVALCTSLPELVSTLAAVRMGAFDLALGNIFGSNAFNMILLAPLDLIYKGPLLASVSKVHIFTSFAAILITSVAVMGQLYQVEKRKRFVEPDALLVITLVLACLFLVYFFRGA
jgi:cation:H+ antiporter